MWKETKKIKNTQEKRKISEDVRNLFRVLKEN